MHPQVQATLEELERATAGMSAEEWQRHPEGKWSAGEVVEHLSIAFNSTARGLQRALDAGAPIAAKQTLKGFIGKLLIVKLEYFPEGRKAPSFTEPKGVGGEEAMRTAREGLEKMDAVLSECERRFGDVVIGPHPVLGPLTVSQWRKFHLIHTRHHMKQVARLRGSRPN